MRTSRRSATLLVPLSLPLAVSLSLTALTGPPAQAATTASEVLSHYYDSGLEIAPSADIVCAPGGTAIEGTATFGTEPGDLWTGTTSYDFCLYPTDTPDEYTYSGRETLTGSVTGCGTGSFTWIGTGHSMDGGVWRIVAGSGTGDLTGARGSGTSTATTTPALENFGEFAGTFAC
ncbi:DUF3224 domain-containing protein [Streptomyces sp. NPDC093252]|uniref:DUF3224 domain-containing protein n=1 Tax=Streptomyces sp. NPDC093252 TaxID=3154980 RepID=UPI0034433F2E